MTLREWARGKPCMLRIPSVCDGGGETTVLAHIRRGHTGGIGLKPPDLCSVLACGPCHDVLDGRRPAPDWHPLDVLDAHLRTLVLVDREFELKERK